MVTFNYSGDPNTGVVCCCKLNNTLVCDERLFGHVSTYTVLNQLPILQVNSSRQNNE